ncbi:DUF6634 family protein [Rhizobium tubonense]|uniref:Uncharacterized protein n=1 Tax=Rhizobium tubonense TaxID=484088 RepID=A0A2W4CMC9_9HYPH|nr:DUF6634 family protein [Rhizobium tubonense]PZM13721.1 hypothetical protein CPY51_12610 [Rhizobium tubonense]
MNFQMLLDLPRLQRLVADLQRLKVGSVKASSLLDIPTLNDWSFTKRAEACLAGVVHDHPTLPDGHQIITSQLFAHYVEDDKHFVRTLSRWYRIGSPAPEVKS